MTKEIFKYIPGYEGVYKVSNFGRVLRCDKNKFMKSTPTKHGYNFVGLCRNGVKKRRPVHQLVMEAFVGPRPKGLVCCHNNGIHHDNRLENLRYDSMYENAMDRIKHGRSLPGEKCPAAKLTEKQVLFFLK